SIIDNDTVKETTPGKYILKLNDISLFSNNQSNTSNQSTDLP
ncbi:9248_t:CDS:1, partial [Funneliformis caledonium]